MSRLRSLVPESGIQQIVLEVLRAVLNPPPHSTALNFAPTPPTPPILPTPTFDHVCSLHHEQLRESRDFRPQFFSPSPKYAPRRRTDIWRTRDRRLVCFYCNSAGHILRYCRRRIDNEFSRGNATVQAGFNDANQGDRRPRRPSPVKFRRSRTPPSYPRRARSLSPLRDATAAGHPQSN